MFLNFSVYNFLIEIFLNEVFDRRAGCLLSLVGDEFLIFLDLFWPLDNVRSVVTRLVLLAKSLTKG